MRKILKIVLASILGLIIGIISVLTIIKPKAETITSTDLNTFEIDLDLYGEEFNMSYNDLGYYLATDIYEFENYLSGYYSVSDVVGCVGKLHLEIDFNTSTIYISVERFDLIKSGAFVDLTTDLIYGMGDGATYTYNEGFRVDFGTGAIGFFNDYWYVGFMLYTPGIITTDSANYKPTQLVNEYSTQGIEFSYMNTEITDDMKRDSKYISWSFGNHNYGSISYALTYRSTYENNNNYDMGYIYGSQRTKAEIKNNPNKYGLYSEQDYNNNWWDGYNTANDENGTGVSQNWFLSIFTGLSQIFNIKIFGEITLGMIALIPFSIEFILVIFKIVRGGD